MTTFDFTPLYRNSIGFDRLASLLSSAQRVEQGGGYPPYNILAEDENRYRITMAVAGFSPNELSITTENNRLVVTGEKAEDQETDDNAFLYRGIATRSFERRFNLAEHVRVTGARLDNGLLHIELEREIPEAMKPRTIEINSVEYIIRGIGFIEDLEDIEQSVVAVSDNVPIRIADVGHVEVVAEGSYTVGAEGLPEESPVRRARVPSIPSSPLASSMSRPPSRNSPRARAQRTKTCMLAPVSVRPLGVTPRRASRSAMASMGALPLGSPPPPAFR